MWTEEMLARGAEVAVVAGVAAFGWQGWRLVRSPDNPRQWFICGAILAQTASEAAVLAGVAQWLSAALFPGAVRLVGYLAATRPWPGCRPGWPGSTSGST